MINLVHMRREAKDITANQQALFGSRESLDSTPNDGKAKGLETFADWDFATADSRSLSHGFHPWPAKFIPQIPARLVEELTEPGDVVFDPFCGSGTTLVEALIRGRHAWGNDNNPLAALLSKVKATPLDSKRLTLAIRTTMRARAAIERGHEPQQDVIPQAPRLEYWFQPHVISELAVIKSVMNSCPDPDVRNFLRIGFSAIIVGVSNQDSETRYSRVLKDISPREPIRRFERKISSMVAGMSRLAECRISARSKVTCEDSQELASYPDGVVATAIFSPPYLNAFDYHLYHRFRLFWLDMNPIGLRKKEIGAHLKYEPDESIYATEMQQCFKRFAQVLRPHGTMAVVIGDSLVRGRIIQNDLLLEGAAENVGFKIVFKTERAVPATRKVFNQSMARLKHEHVLVLELCS